MFMDEARFGLISATRYCWCPKPIRPVCQAMVSQEYTYAYAAVSVRDGKMDSLENHLEEALRNLENNPNRVHSIVAWPWIINAL
jgi:ABC-type Fe3+ transport system permease subunit